MADGPQKYVYDAWYCGGWARDFDEKPVRRHMLDVNLVIYKTAAGEFAALADMCPHRFAPLSMGQVRGESIECRYHGLRFDKNGTCVLNPNGRGITPSSARVRSYPIEERSGVLWIWMGNPACVDASKIPEFDFVTNDSEWDFITGYVRVDADYRLVIDNLLDLVHVNFLHPNTVGVANDLIVGDVKIEIDYLATDREITSNFVVRNAPPSGMFSLIGDLKTGDIHAPITLHAPSSVILDLEMTAPGAPRRTGVRTPSAHLVVPEDDAHTHYYFCFSYNRHRGQAAVRSKISELIRRTVLDEDVPMINAIQRAMDGREFFSMRPVMFENDTAAVQARRLLDRLIDLERNPG